MPKTLTTEDGVAGRFSPPPGLDAPESTGYRRPLSQVLRCRTP
jgi:hypothetical protein